MPFRFPYEDSYGLSDRDLDAARRRAALLAGLGIMSRAGQGPSVIGPEILRGFEEHTSTLDDLYKRRRQEKKDEQSSEYTDLLMEVNREALGDRRAARTAQGEAAASAAERARGYREYLADTPYAGEAAFADLDRLEELADLYYKESGEPPPVKPLKVTDEMGVRLIDPETGEEMLDVPKRYRPKEGGEGAEKGGIPSQERMTRETIRKEIAAEEDRLRKEHEAAMARRLSEWRSTAGEDAGAPPFDTTPDMDKIRRRATESVLERYAPEEIPGSLRNFYASKGYEMPGFGREDIAVAETVSRLMVQATPKQAAEIEANMPVVVDLLREGQTPEDILKSLREGFTLADIARMYAATR